jgi:hypothetical protein
VAAGGIEYIFDNLERQMKAFDILDESTWDLHFIQSLYGR